MSTQGNGITMPRKKRDDLQRLVWVREGDHNEEVELLLQKSEKENGRLMGSPTVMLREFPAGIFTVLGADPIWWREEMRLHPEWGDPSDSNDDFLSRLGDAGVPKP